MAVHKDAIASECHEDKLIIPAITGDAGKVVTPSASTAGEGVLRQLDNSEILNTPSDFGNMVITNNITVQALTAASDITFNTTTDYVVTTPAHWSGEFNVDGVTMVSGSLKVAKAGLYLISGFFSAKSSVANTRIAFKYAVNTTTFSPRKVQNEAPTANSETNFAGSAYLELSVNDEVCVYIAADKNCNITITDANIEITMLRNNT